MVSLCLIFLISSCATTSIPAGFHPSEDGTEQCIENDGARDVAIKLTERRICLDKLGRQPSVWDRFSSGFTVFGIGVGVGAVGALIVGP